MTPFLLAGWPFCCRRAPLPSCAKSILSVTPALPPDEPFRKRNPDLPFVLFSRYKVSTTSDTSIEELQDVEILKLLLTVEKEKPSLEEGAIYDARGPGNEVYGRKEEDLRRLSASMPVCPKVPRNSDTSNSVERYLTVSRKKNIPSLTKQRVCG